MRFIPAWLAAAPSNGPYGLIACPPPSTPYSDTLGVLALLALGIIIPFLAGRFWGRRPDLPRRERAAKTLALALALAIPCWLVFHLALRGKYLGEPLSIAVILVHLAGAAFILGRLRGRHEGRLREPDDVIPL